MHGLKSAVDPMRTSIVDTCLPDGTLIVVPVDRSPTEQAGIG